METYQYDNVILKVFYDQYLYYYVTIPEDECFVNIDLTDFPYDLDIELDRKDDENFSVFVDGQSILVVKKGYETQLTDYCFCHKKRRNRVPGQFELLREIVHRRSLYPQ